LRGGTDLGFAPFEPRRRDGMRLSSDVPMPALGTFSLRVGVLTIEPCVWK
jgi:hypothetical protein